MTASLGKVTLAGGAAVSEGMHIPLGRNEQQCNDIREALDEAVFVADLAALVLSVLLCRSDLVSVGIRLAGDLSGNEQQFP